MSKRASAPAPASTEELVAHLRSTVIGQIEALDSIVPFIEMTRAGLGPRNRPAGVFLLLGPTGTGKTRTVEALAEALHGDYRSMVKIECGEFQLEHEVSKLIGAPPGYLGHRETTPYLTQEKLASVVSAKCGISLVLFDEIEKAAPSMQKMLLGIMDRATLRTGDGHSVNFSNSLIFLTSNLGAHEINRELRPFGLAPPAVRSMGAHKAISAEACRRRFSPEFMNRIDSVLVYERLTPEALKQILEIAIRDVQVASMAVQGAAGFQPIFSAASKEFLLKRGTSPEYGARELNRAVHKFVMQPLARMLISGRIQAGDVVVIDALDDELRFRIRRRRTE